MSGNQDDGQWDDTRVLKLSRVHSSMQDRKAEPWPHSTLIDPKCGAHRRHQYQVHVPQNDLVEPQKMNPSPEIASLDDTRSSCAE